MTIVGWDIVRGSVAATQTDAGYWVADKALSAPSGKFVVGGGYMYSNSSNPAGVKATANGLRSFSALVGSTAFPTAWETTIEAQSAGTLYVDIVCADLPSS